MKIANIINITTTDGFDEFYPTPDELAEKMLAEIDWRNIHSILEPSAGKGNLIKCAIEAHQNAYAEYNGQKYKLGLDMSDIDCIEIDKNLRHILSGEGYRVIHDDFLTYNGHKHYDLILMNPPFSEGDKHFLKALDIQKGGGMIVCLLNSETIRNPYTNTRKLLIQLLNKYAARIQYVKGAFAQAERRTGVECAIVKVAIPEVKRRSEFYERMKKAAEADEPMRQTSTEITLEDFLQNIVDQYNVETAAAIELIREYDALTPHMLESCGEPGLYNGPILALKIRDRERSGYHDVTINDYLREVRLKYWNALLSNKEFIGRLTTNMQKQFRETVNKLTEYEFSIFNIQNVAIEINASVVAGVKETILGLFDKLSLKHSYHNECKNNIHYWNGWKTNKAHKVNYKVIIPTWGMYSEWRKDGRFETSKAMDVLFDIEKAFNYLDGGLTDDVDLYGVLDAANQQKINRNIKCKYFDVTLYKKGTTHIKFTNTALVDKLNIYAARDKKWLPPDYGYKPYKEMDGEARKAVDEFQGETEYDKVMADKSYYLFDVKTDAPLMLEGAK